MATGRVFEFVSVTDFPSSSEDDIIGEENETNFDPLFEDKRHRIKHEFGVKLENVKVELSVGNATQNFWPEAYSGDTNDDTDPLFIDKKPNITCEARVKLENVKVEAPMENFDFWPDPSGGDKSDPLFIEPERDVKPRINVKVDLGKTNAVKPYWSEDSDGSQDDDPLFIDEGQSIKSETSSGLGNVQIEVCKQKTAKDIWCGSFNRSNKSIQAAGKVKNKTVHSKEENNIDPESTKYKAKHDEAGDLRVRTVKEEMGIVTEEMDDLSSAEIDDFSANDETIKSEGADEGDNFPLSEADDFFNLLDELNIEFDESPPTSTGKSKEKESSNKRVTSTNKTLKMPERKSVKNFRKRCKMVDNPSKSDDNKSASSSSVEEQKDGDNEDGDPLSLLTDLPNYSYYYSCPKCGEVFTSAVKLKMHLRTHTESTLHECKICKKVFLNKFYLTRHSKMHAKMRPYLCRVCNIHFDSKRELLTHSEIHIGGDSNMCLVCNIGFLSKDRLIRHSEVHEKNPLLCIVCNKRFVNNKSFRNHLQTHKGKDKPFVCSVCGKKFLEKPLLINHLRFHVVSRPEDPRSCDKPISEAKEASTHSEKSPMEERLATGSLKASEIEHVCEMCGEKFSSKWALAGHSRVHPVSKVSHSSTGNSTLKVVNPKSKPSTSGSNAGRRSLLDVWQNLFKAKNSLLNQSKSRVREKPQTKKVPEKTYTCNICGKVYPTQFKLEFHSRVHAGLNFTVISNVKESKDSTDLVCNKLPVEKPKLSSSNDKPYLCEVCGEIFPSTSLLLIHSRIHASVPVHNNVKKDKSSKATTKNGSLLGCICDKGCKSGCELLEPMAVIKLRKALDAACKPKTPPSYECEVCGKSFSARWILTAHSKKHSYVKPDPPSMATLQENGMSFPSRFPADNNPGKCCGPYKPLASTQVSGKRSVHSMKMPFVCLVCGCGFTSDSELSAHLISHANMKPYLCDVCGETFSVLATLEMHSNIHTVNSLHDKVNVNISMHDSVGSVCKDSQLSVFAPSKQKHSDHLKIYSGEKPYACSICNKSFTARWILVAHSRIHLEEKNPNSSPCGAQSIENNALSRLDSQCKNVRTKCTACANTLSSNDYFLDHLLPHTCKKLLDCKVCDKTFLTRRKLLAHLRSHIGERTLHGAWDMACRMRSNLLVHLKFRVNNTLFHTIFNTASRRGGDLLNFSGIKDDEVSLVSYPHYSKYTSAKCSQCNHACVLWKKNPEKIPLNACSGCGTRFKDRFSLLSKFRINPKTSKLFIVT